MSEQNNDTPSLLDRLIAGEYGNPVDHALSIVRDLSQGERGEFLRRLYTERRPTGGSHD